MGPLADILATDRLAAAAGRRDAVRAAVEKSGCLLFGPGNNGRQLASHLSRLRGGSPALAFVSDVTADQGRTLEGLPVLTRQEALALHGPETPVVNCVYRADVTIGKVAAGLRASGFRRVLSLPEIHTAFEELPTIYGYGSTAFLAEEAARIAEAYDLLADEPSRRSYAGLLAQRISLDFSTEREVDPAIYFTGAVPLARLSRDGSPFVFVDCGAYVGDTLRDFAAWNGSRPAHVVAVEPDPESFARLEAVAAAVSFETSCVNAAVGASEGRVGFLPLSNEASRISPDAATSVPLVTVDALLEQRQLTGSYVKYDVEGFENDALTGTERSIARDAVGLAVSVYHAPEDLWRILLRLHDLQPAYEFRLREHGPDGVDTVLYALPGK